MLHAPDQIGSDAKAAKPIQEHATAILSLISDVERNTDNIRFALFGSEPRDESLDKQEFNPDALCERLAAARVRLERACRELDKLRARV